MGSSQGKMDGVQFVQVEEVESVIRDERLWC
jgi:hypothetical protein